MSKAMRASCFNLTANALAYRIENISNWLDGVGAIEFVQGHSFARIIPSLELLLPHTYQGVVVNRLSYTRKGLLISANGEIAPDYIEALSCLNPGLAPFKDGHYAKLLAPDSDGEVTAYFSALLKTSKPIVHKITSDGTFKIRELDFLCLPDRFVITATAAYGDGRPNQAMNLDNTDDLAQFEFAPRWSKLPWSEGHDIRSLEGFTNGVGGVAFLFIDQKTSRLMKVIDGKAHKVISEEAKDNEVQILFRTATGAEVDKNHLASAGTHERLIELSMANNGKMDITVSNSWMAQNHSGLQKMLDEVSEMDRPEGIMSPHGFFISKNTNGGKVLIHRPRPHNL